MPEATIQQQRQEELFQQPPDNKTLRGQVTRIIRHFENTGFIILRVHVPEPNNEIVSVTGHASNIRQGDTYEFTGKWGDHKTYGKQFQFESAEVILPQSKPGIVSYIADIAYGIGRKKAGAIYDRLGDNCLEIIAQGGPGALMGIQGVTPQQAEEIHAKLTQNATLAEVAAMVCGEGVGPSLAHKIYNQYGKEAVTKIRENPFVLADEMFGVGFKTADKIARHVGVAVDSPYRIQAAYKFTLKTAAEEGHCYLKPGQTIPGYEMVESGGKSRRKENVAAQVLGFTAEIGVEQIRDASMELIRREECVRETDPENGSRIYLKGMYEAETALAGDILRLLGQEAKEGAGKDGKYIEALIDDYQNRTSMEFAPEQRQAIVAAMQSRLSVLTGGPGTGKTASINAIISAYQVIHPSHKIYLASPTGRAAKRMSECTGGREAKTIHRLLRFNPHEGGFQHNRYCQLEGPGLLVLDELSMCDCSLAASVFEAVPDDMTVVLVGDEDQLPSVGPGKVLGDIIRSGVVPVTRLNRIFRQADGSGIAALAHQIRAGEGMGFCLDDVAFCRADGAAEAADVAVQQAIQAVEEYGLMGFQLLTPQRRGPAGVDALNERLQEVLNPAEFGKPELKAGRVFRVGDKAMVIKNNYKKGVFNGDMGMVTGVGEGVTADGTKEQGIYVEIDGGGVFFGRSEIDQLMLAYCSTTHRAQGGEHPCVIYVCITSHFIMLQRQQVYTAITRAKKQLIVVGQEKAVSIAAKNAKVDERNTWLAERLRGGG